MERIRIFFLLLLLLLCICVRGQTLIPRDTSFTVYSAWEKVKKKFPEALPVKTIVSNDFIFLPNQVYRIRGGRKLCMDVFLPLKNKHDRRPAILMIHGGGWKSGDKSHLLPLAQYLAINNYVVANVEYRLSPEAKYPAAIYDLKEAIRFVKHQCDVYEIDTSQVAILGTSAGATLASFMATTGQVAKFNDPESVYHSISSQVHALINMDGVLDFTHPAESGKDNDPHQPSAGAMFLGATFNEKPDIWQEASPVNYLGKNTPPTLFINSSIPRFRAGREEFIDTLEVNKVYNEVYAIPNTPHPYWLFYPWFDEAKVYVLNFLNKVFE